MIKPQESIVLETNRLILRPITIDDASPMYKNWASDPEVSRYLTWEAHESIETTKAIINNWCLKYLEQPTFFLWLIVLKSNQEPIGTTNLFNVDHLLLSGEVGYCIGKKYWNHGYMTEALMAILAYAFIKNNFQKITAKHAIENPASGKVMLKCGFHYEKTSFKASNRPYQSGHLLEYSISRKEWMKGKDKDEEVG